MALEPSSQGAARSESESAMRVTLRTKSSTKERTLESVPIDKLDEVIPALGKWGVVTESGSYGRDDLTGQVVFDGDGLRFVVQVEDEG